MLEKGPYRRRGVVLTAILGVTLALPAGASANITSLDPSVQPGSATTVAQAIVAVPGTLTSATSNERAYGGTGTPSPMGVGCVTNTNGSPQAYCTTGAPQTLTGFPTDGATYGILSSGYIDTIASLTDPTGNHTDDFTNQIVTGNRGEAEDYTVLSLVLNVPGGADCLALDYRFLSEEYPDYVNSEFNDAFIAELDGSTWSVDSSGSLTRNLDFAASPAGKPVSVNGAGPTAMFPAESAGTYFNAATGLVTTKTPITSGTHTVNLSMFDANDSLLDSAVFLDRLRLTSESASTCQPPLGLEPAGAPSNEFSLGGGSTIKLKNGQGTITFTLPGPGTVSLSDASGAGTASASARIAKKKKKKRKPLVAPTSATATAAGPLAVPFKLTGHGKKVLKSKKNKKLGASISATYTPTGGQPKTQVLQLTLKG